ARRARRQSGESSAHYWATPAKLRSSLPREDLVSSASEYAATPKRDQAQQQEHRSCAKGQGRGDRTASGLRQGRRIGVGLRAIDDDRPHHVVVNAALIGKGATVREGERVARWKRRRGIGNDARRRHSR